MGVEKSSDPVPLKLCKAAESPPIREAGGSPGTRINCHDLFLRRSTSGKWKVDAPRVRKKIQVGCASAKLLRKQESVKKGFFRITNDEEGW
ncbi:hypothetical protein OPV22_009837 [Ensete ventricosum]|uniref:Uncharacterized protein n=1 Tax=Ensete ventricosum TaxID=4639 RepID=A0AAV8PSK4_ENSVE|nr:hypothetical protein OPV22_009837 [Ensete ventricosum]